MIYSNIKQALEDILKSVSDANSVPVAWPNIDYNPSDGVYYQPYLIPVETKKIGFSLTDDNDYAGIFQVSVNFYKGTGTAECRQAVDDLLTGFYKGVSQTVNGDRVFIEQSSVAAQVEKTEGWFYIPVSIRYRCFSG